MTNFPQRKRSELAVMPSFANIKNVPPDAKQFGESLKTICQWKKSVYKLLWKHAALYFLIYLLLTCLYRFGLDDDGKNAFKEVSDYCRENRDVINISIMLGFFTHEALRGQLKMILELPGIYKSIGLFIMSFKKNIPERTTLVATYARWQLLCWVLTFRMVCKPLRRVYPDMMSLKKAGLLLERERLALEDEEISERNTPRPIIVIEWMLHLLKECQIKEALIDVDPNIEALLTFKKKCSTTIKYSMGSIPKPITQALIIGVYAVGAMTILGRDLGDKEDKAAKLFILNFLPLLPSIEFFSFLSWLSLGRAALQPFGDDDNDIDIFKYINSHFESVQRLASFESQSYEALFSTDSRVPVSRRSSQQFPSDLETSTSTL